MSRKRLIVVSGPTAVGKTAVAITLAEHFGTEIISADSRQCYREMTIGTAKPSEEELRRVKHYFINSHSIAEDLNAGDYERLALEYCADIFNKKDTAIVCGGTGLYLKALCEGIDEMPGIDKEIEKAVRADYAEKGMEWLSHTTGAEDPEFFMGAEQQNPARLMRALVFKRSTGQSIIHFRSARVKDRAFEIVKIALELPRAVLYERINDRVDEMMHSGLLQEAAALYPQRHLKNLQTVGYSEIFNYLDGKTSLEDCVDLIKQHSRNYAKRQLTWFKKDRANQWFAPSEIDAIIDYITSHV